MSIAKITSFFGGFVYLVLFTSVLFFGEAFSSVLFENFGIADNSLFALILAATFLFTVGNFCFSYFIQQRERYHESLESAFFFSLQLLIIPAILFVGFIVIFVSLNR